MQIGRSPCRQLLLTLFMYCPFFPHLHSREDSLIQPRSFYTKPKLPTPYHDFMSALWSLLCGPSSPSRQLSLSFHFHATFTFTFTIPFIAKNRQTDAPSRPHARNTCYGARPKPRLKVCLHAHPPHPPSSHCKPTKWCSSSATAHHVLSSTL